MSVAAFPRTHLGPAPAPTRRTIPYDHSFTYELAGEVNKVSSKTLTVSIEGIADMLGTSLKRRE